MLRCLLQRGADPSLKNRFGELPIEEAPIGWGRSLFHTYDQVARTKNVQLLPSAALQLVTEYLDARTLSSMYAVCSRWKREVATSQAWQESEQLRHLQWQSLTNNPFGNTAMSTFMRPSSSGSPPTSSFDGGNNSFGSSQRKVRTAPSTSLGGLGINILGGRSAFGTGLGGLGGSLARSKPQKKRDQAGPTRSRSSRGGLVFSSPVGGDFF